MLRKLIRKAWRWIREFLNDPDEWHAFWIGFFEPWTWWWRGSIPRPTMGWMAKEFHYYRMGKAIGATLQIVIVIVVIRWIRGF